MANKPKKKRNKQYRGADAALTKPVVTKVQAADRNALGQWWFEHKRIAKPVIITGIIILVVAWLIAQIIYFVN